MFLCLQKTTLPALSPLPIVTYCFNLENKHAPTATPFFSDFASFMNASQCVLLHSRSLFIFRKCVIIVRAAYFNHQTRGGCISSYVRSAHAIAKTKQTPPHAVAAHLQRAISITYLLTDHLHLLSYLQTGVHHTPPTSFVLFFGPSVPSSLLLLSILRAAPLRSLRVYLC